MCRKDGERVIPRAELSRTVVCVGRPGELSEGMKQEWMRSGAAQRRSGVESETRGRGVGGRGVEEWTRATMLSPHSPTH